MTAIHELFHVLGFSPDAYELFLDEHGNRHRNPTGEYVSASGARGTAITTPKVLAYAKQFYGCSSWDGIPLENDGGDGSLGAHLERSMFFNESMTSSDIKNAVVSGFTWKIMEDSGWYGEVDPNLYEPFNAGKGKGCDFKKACFSSNNDDYYCKKGTT